MIEKKILIDLINNKKELENLVDITFFVPCYNEELNIVNTLNNITNVGQKLDLDYEILVVNDGSKDATKDIVEDFMQNNGDKPIRLINNKINRGLGFNYIKGAFLGVGKHYMLVCGDNSEPEETLCDIIKEKGTADMIIPYYGKADKKDQRSFSRKTTSLVFTAIINFLNGNKIKYYNGPVIHTRHNVQRWHPMTTGFAYQAELISSLLDEHHTYKEVPISNSDREHGVTRAFHLKNFLSIFHSMLQILLRRIRHGIWPV